MLFKDGLQTGAGHGGYFSKYFSLFFAFCLDRAVFDFCAKNFKMLMFFGGGENYFALLNQEDVCAMDGECTYRIYLYSIKITITKVNLSDRRSTFSIQCYTLVLSNITAEISTITLTKWNIFGKQKNCNSC